MERISQINIFANDTKKNNANSKHGVSPTLNK